MQKYLIHHLADLRQAEIIFGAQDIDCLNHQFKLLLDPIV